MQKPNGSVGMADQKTASSESKTEPNNSNAAGQPGAADSVSGTAQAGMTQANAEQTSRMQSSGGQVLASSKGADAKGSSGKGLSIFAVLLSLLALGGSGFNVYTSHIAKQANEGKILTNVNSIGSDVKVLAERMAQLQRAQQSIEQSSVTQDQLQTRLLQANNQNDLALRDIKQSQQGFSDALKNLSANSERSADKLALDEVSQLLKLANNSAVFSNNRDSAISALRLADSQLKQLADPRYSVVRRTINQEINQLEAVKSIDVTRVTADLSAVSVRVPSLPLENEPPVIGQINIAEPQKTDKFSFRSELKKLWVDVVNVIKIKQVDQMPKPLLAPEQRYFLDQNIQLKLNAAEFAAMQSKPEIYQRNVDSAIKWLLDYYDPRDEDVIKTVAELRELKAEPMGTDLPSIAGSYDALQRIRGGN